MEKKELDEVAANIFRSSIRPPVESAPERFIHEQVRAFGRNLPAPGQAPRPAPSPAPVGAPPGVPPPGPGPRSQETVRRDGKKIGPNDPCPCGSGKKFKKCCGR